MCVGAQPISWHWNVGKLLALIAPTLGDVWTARYGDPLLGVTTTSVWGRSSQYNRIYRNLGFTKGYGHEQVTDEVYAEMITWMRKHDVEIPSTRFGAGSNGRMRRIAAYRAASGDRSISMKHGHLRGVYYHPAVPPEQRPAVIRGWFDRWGRPRYERTRDQIPPYTTGGEPSLKEIVG